MKHLLYIAALALLAGCLSPERVTRSTLEIHHGTNYIKSSTPKEYKVKKLKWSEDGIEVEGLNSAVNVNAVEAQVHQAELLQQGFAQSLQMLQFMSAIAGNYFSGRNVAPQVITNFVYVPVSAINTITNK